MPNLINRGRRSIIFKDDEGVRQVLRAGHEAEVPESQAEVILRLHGREVEEVAPRQKDPRAELKAMKQTDLVALVEKRKIQLPKNTKKDNLIAVLLGEYDYEAEEGDEA